jgi:hypothetical protein
MVDGKAIVLEEGEALKALYEKFFQSRQGFLDEKTNLFRKARNPRDLSSLPPGMAPSLSSVWK